MRQGAQIMGQTACESASNAMKLQSCCEDHILTTGVAVCLHQLSEHMVESVKTAPLCRVNPTTTDCTKENQTVQAYVRSAAAIRHVISTPKHERMYQSTPMSTSCTGTSQTCTYSMNGLPTICGLAAASVHPSCSTALHND